MGKNDKDPLLVSATPSVRGADTDSDVQFDLRAVFRGLKRRRKTMALVMAGVFAAGMLYTAFQRPSYESTTRLLVSPSKRPGVLSMAGTTMPADLGSLFGSKSVETEAEILSDDQLLQSAYDSLSASERKTAFGGKRKRPTWAVNVSPKRGTDVVEIKAISHSPNVSAHLANNIVKIYFAKDFDENSNSTRKARKYAGSRMQFINKQLAVANKKVAEFKRRNHLIAPVVQLEKFTGYTVNLQTELDTATTQQAAGRRETAMLERQINKQQPNVVSGDVIRQNPRFVAIASNLDTLCGKRIEGLQEFQPQSPEIRSLDSQIKQEEARLKQTTERIAESVTHSRNRVRDDLTTNYASALAKQAATEASLGVLKRMLAAQSKAADSLPDKERQFLELQGQVDLLGRAYGLISDRYYSLLLTEQQNIPRAQIVAKAIPDLDPISPSWPMSVAVFLALGATVALISGLVSESMDTRVREPQKAEQASGYFTSALVPLVANGASPYIVHSHPASAMLESFRVLRNNIYFAGIERRLKTFAITSAGRGEGKTLTCANLAAVMAMDRKSVVIVDCNMGHPTISELIGKRHGFGLTDVLAGGCDLDKAIVQCEQDNLFLVPSGPVIWNLPELLNSQNGRKTFAQLAERFDYVLIDCPSLARLADLQMISTVADGILLVVRLEKTLAPDLSAASESLSGIGIPVLGLVVNGDETGQARADATSGKGRLGESPTGNSKIAGRRS